MIKTFYYLFIAGAILSAAGCKKTGVIVDTDNGCISSTTNNYFNIVTDSAGDAQLLQQNNIPTGNLKFISGRVTDTITNSTGTNVYTDVTALQKSKSLLIFNSLVTYHFKNNLYSSITGQIYNPTINLSTTPKLSLPQVRKLFIDAVAGNNTYKNIDFTDSCLGAQFGYYDIDAGGSTGPNIVPAWFVTLQQGPPTLQQEPSPAVYIRDDNKTIIH